MPLMLPAINVIISQTEPISIVKALYDYEAAAGGELSIIEGETLLVYGKEEDWLLVKCERDGGKVGYVPGNYVGEVRFNDAFIISSLSNIWLRARDRLRTTHLISLFRTQ
jgi:SH3 domain